VRFQFPPAAPRWLELGVLVLATIIRIAAISRNGMSTDEELTWFAVTGVVESGVPRMPSGWVYDRGLLYTYACAIPAAVLGVSMPLLRGMAAVFSVAAIAAVMALTRRLTASAAAAVMVGAVVAVSPFHVQHAALARFYEPLLLMYLLALLAGIDAGGRPARLVLVSLCACLARLSHELAWTGLLIVPAVVLADRATRVVPLRSLAVPATWAAGGLVLGEAIARLVSHGPLAAPLMSGYRGIFGSVMFATPNWNLAVIMPWWLPPATVTAALLAAIPALRHHAARGPLAIMIVAATVSAAAGQLGIAALTVLLSAIAWPPHARPLLRTGFIICGASFIAWLAAVRSLADAPLTSLARQVWWQSTEFPWRGARHMFATATALSSIALLTLWRGAGGRIVSTGGHAAAVFWFLWALLLGVTLQSLADRFMLIPLITATIAGGALVARFVQRPFAIAAALSLAAIVIGEDAARSSRNPAVATWDLSPVAESLAGVDADSVLACNNPLVIRMYGRRCDLWFVPAPAAPADAIQTASGPIHRFDGAPLAGSIDEIVSRTDRRQAIVIVLVESGSSSILEPGDLLDQLRAAGRPGLVRRRTPDSVTLVVPSIE
jgi:hypothetical protein